MHLTAIVRFVATDSMEKLQDNFIPGAFDVICARGKEAYQHRGNKSFRATLEHHLPAYATATNKLKKSEIVSAIFHAIEEATPDGGFIRKNDKGQWCRVPVHIAREKIGQGFRDLLFTEYRSSTKAKILRRRERLYPSNSSPDKKPAASQATATKAIGPTADSAMPPLKNPSFDIQPLPLSSSNETHGELTILHQCSFSSINHVDPRAENGFAPSDPVASQPVGTPAESTARMAYYHPGMPIRANYSVGYSYAGPTHPLDSSHPPPPYPYHHHIPRHDSGGSYYHHARAWSWSGNYGPPPGTEADGGHPYWGYPNNGNAHSWGE